MFAKLSQLELESLQLNADLTCLPRSGRGIVIRAKKENWDSITVPGKGGPRGMKTLYTLPDYVIQELRSRDLLHLIQENSGKDGIITITETLKIKDIEPKNDNTTKSYEKAVKANNTKAYKKWATEQRRNDIIPIRYYRNVYASAGNGAFNFDESADVMWFRAPFIEEHLSIPPEELACIRVKGDSMTPTITPGGAVMLRLSCRYEGEGVYLIRQGEELKIKRLQMVTANKMLIISDNKDMYPIFELDLTDISEEDFIILGKCLWHSTTMA